MRKQKYTLVEILSVVAIIAILCGIIFGVSGAIHNRNAEVKTRAMLKQIEIALEECKNKFGYYPSQSSFGDFAENLITSQSTKYVEEFKKSCNFTSFEINGGNICDAYGEPLQYKSNGKSYTIYSRGQDGKDSVVSGELVEPKKADGSDDIEHENFDNIYLD